MKDTNKNILIWIKKQILVFKDNTKFPGLPDSALFATKNVVVGIHSSLLSSGFIETFSHVIYL